MLGGWTGEWHGIRLGEWVLSGWVLSEWVCIGIGEAQRLGRIMRPSLDRAHALLASSWGGRG